MGCAVSQAVPKGGGETTVGNDLASTRLLGGFLNGWPCLIWLPSFFLSKLPSGIPGARVPHDNEAMMNSLQCNQLFNVTSCLIAVSTLSGSQVSLVNRVKSGDIPPFYFSFLSQLRSYTECSVYASHSCPVFNRDSSPGPSSARLRRQGWSPP